MITYKIRIIPDVRKFEAPGGFQDLIHVDSIWNDMELIVQNMETMGIEFADSVPVQWSDGEHFLAWRYANVQLVRIKELPHNSFACGMRFGPSDNFYHKYYQSWRW